MLIFSKKFSDELFILYEIAKKVLRIVKALFLNLYNNT